MPISAETAISRKIADRGAKAAKTAPNVLAASSKTTARYAGAAGHISVISRAAAAKTATTDARIKSCRRLN
jgi:hypothetical protein